MSAHCTVSRGRDATGVIDQELHASKRCCLIVALLFLMAALGCDSAEQRMHIVAEDFRFTPTELRVSAARPIRLTIVNEGREPHEFQSPLLDHQLGAGPDARRTVRLQPNDKAETMIRAIPGVYLFSCAIRGHAGMSGTIVVE